MEDLNKSVDLPNTVTVGHICLSCGLLATESCPYGNHNKKFLSQFEGDIRGKCSYYQPILEANRGKRMKKEAKNMTDAELNIEIYKKIFSMSDELKEKTENYWELLFPKEYAEEMVDDINKSKAKNLTNKNKIEKKEIKVKKKEEPKSWFKRKNKFDSGMVEPFKR